MHIVMASSEVAPFSKTGGLGDVAGALPPAFEKAGEKITVFTPLYGQVAENAKKLGVSLETAKAELVRIPLGERECVLRIAKSHLPGSEIPVYFLENDYYFDRSGLYVDPATEKDYPDNCERFILFSRGVMRACMKLGLDVDVFHAHDWQTGLMPVYNKHMYRQQFANAVSVLTIHNVAFQGVFPSWNMSLTGLPEELFDCDQLEFFGNISLLKGGLVNADGLTTVSRQYAREIQSKEFGMKLEGVIGNRSNDLRGIVNGVDYSIWNPETDELIPANYSTRDLSGKSVCKKQLQKEFGLQVNENLPVLGLIGRLVHQKGYDLVLEEIDCIMNEGLQIVLLGEGHEIYHNALEKAAQAYPERFATKLDFDERAAHLIEAGADMFLMPSRYEPCGLNQLYSMKYGTVPLVAATGGLVDTVKDRSEDAEGATGFFFKPDNAKEMSAAVTKAVNIYKNHPRQWQGLLLNCMKEDWSWERSAAQYLDFFREKLEHSDR